MTMANVNVLGRVGTIRVFENGEAEGQGKVVAFGLAVDQRRSSEGQQEPPVWFNFRAFGALADILAQHLQKGRLLYVSGASPRLRSYDVERQIQLGGKLVKFTDRQVVTEYAVRDFSFADAPRDGNGNTVLVGTVVGDAPDGDAPADQAEPVLDPDNIPF